MGGGEVMLERLAGLAPLVGAHVDLGLLFGRSVPLAPALRARFRRVGCFDFPRRLRLAEASGLRRNHRALAGWLTGEPTRACVSMTFATAVRGALATLGTPTALMWMCNFSVRTAGWWPTAKRSAALRCLGLSGAIAVCPSLVTRAELASLGYPDSQLRVINNGVDLARYAPRPVSDEERQHFRGWFRARHGVPSADLVAVCTARIDPIKNHEVLIQAVAAAGRQGVRVALVCLGDACGDDAGYPARLLARCEELRVETNGYFDVRAASPDGLDPSGLVKGWSVDRVARLLDEAGVRDYAVNAGGDMRLRGRAVPGPCWRVGIQHPLELDKVAKVVEANDLAVATSGEYARGQHVLDPHTHRPPSGILSVTITGPDLATADAYATAAFAMGAARAPHWTARLRGYEALTILADGRVLSTPGFPSVD